MEDRISLLKEANKRLQLQRKRVNNNVKRLYARRKEKGLCDRCTTVSVNVLYEFNGKILIKRKARYCPKHWESHSFRKDMENAISSGSTINTSYPVVTHGDKSNASNPS